MDKLDCASVSEKVYWCMLDFRPWTFWELQQRIQNEFKSFYGEPTISAAIREIRKQPFRKKWNVPITVVDPVLKTRRQNGRGYQYRLNRTIKTKGM